MPRQKRLKTGLLAVGGGMLIIAALVTVQALLQTASTPVTNGEENKASPVEGIPVQVMKPQRRDMVRALTLSANISPWYQATLFGKVSGYLKWVGVDKGDLVKKGQLLAVLEAPEIDDQYKQADADFSIKKLTHERYLGVWNDNPNVIAKQDVDVAAAAAQGAKHLRDSRRTMLGYTNVTAPFTGVITARFADPGTLIQAATGSATQAAPLFTIMDIDTVRVYVGVPQEAALRAKPGIPARLMVQELPGREFTGTVTRTTQSLDPATRTLLAEIDLPNKDHQLLPGMFVNATLYLEQRPNALAIRPLAIVPGKPGQNKSVYVVEEGKARLIPIKTGLDDGSWVEVTEGLTGTEDIVIVGKGTLTEGQPVAASPYNLPVGTPAKQKL